MNRKITHIVFCLFVTTSLCAQDIHFSQYTENHAVINPALTGATHPFRATLAYRDQWRSISAPYRTFGASFETRLKSSSWEQVDKFRGMTFKEKSMGRLAWGLSVFGDKAGSGALGYTQSNFSAATFVPVTKKSFISLGLQASYIQWRIDNSKLVFPSQFNGQTYDPNLPQRDRFSIVSYNYFGFAAGALWSYSLEDKRMASNDIFKTKFGISMYHLAEPVQGFLFTQQNRNARYVVHGDLLYGKAYSNVAYAPSFMVQLRGKTKEIVIGGLIKYYLKDNSKYTGIVKRSSTGYGIYYRNTDALVLVFNYERQEQYSIGLSYDLNISKLAAGSNGRGGFELNLRYTPPKAFLYQNRAVVEKEP